MFVKSELTTPVTIKLHVDPRESDEIAVGDESVRLTPTPNNLLAYTLEAVRQIEAPAHIEALVGAIGDNNRWPFDWEENADREWSRTFGTRAMRECRVS